MMIGRQVVISEFHANSIIRFQNENKKAFEDAIGYLASWAIGSDRERSVSIAVSYTDRDAEITATYWSGEVLQGQCSYCISAIWHPDEQRFSFHS